MQRTTHAQKQGMDMVDGSFQIFQPVWRRPMAAELENQPKHGASSSVSRFANARCLAEPVNAPDPVEKRWSSKLKMNFHRDIISCVKLCI